MRAQVLALRGSAFVAGAIDAAATAPITDVRHGLCRRARAVLGACCTARGVHARIVALFARDSTVFCSARAPLGALLLAFLANCYRPAEVHHHRRGKRRRASYFAHHLLYVRTTGALWRSERHAHIVGA